MAHKIALLFNPIRYKLIAVTSITPYSINEAKASCAVSASLYEQKMSYEQLYAALSKLPCKQAQRIYDHFILGISQAEIGRREGVSRKAVNLSIFYGLQRLEKYLRK